MELQSLYARFSNASASSRARNLILVCVLLSVAAEAFQFPGPVTTRSRQSTVNVCFAFEGSSAISRNAFRATLSLIRATTAALSSRNGRSMFAAAQYGTSIDVVSECTSRRRAFLAGLSSTRQLRSTDVFLTGGLNFCISELMSKAGRNRRIVVIGSGRNTIGSDPDERASLFRSIGGQVFTVGVGGQQSSPSLRAIAGGNSRAFSLRQISPRSIRRVSLALANALCRYLLPLSITCITVLCG
eukprot:GFKZ01012481.1.p1 GENE.GFKZ01012481.1~~GFKZ01012481.1.p1  ORF type:complete len:243 (+),score=3.11 GFKZ01012481.1:108-836(+)